MARRKRRARAGLRVCVASAGLGLALIAGACSPADPGGGASGETQPDQAEYTERGPITYVQVQDSSGHLSAQIDRWNSANPDQPVTLIELPDDVESQREQLVQSVSAGSPDYTVLGLDVIWTAEFAANDWVDPLPADQLVVPEMLPGAVQTGTYIDSLYAMPLTADGGLLYYRSDLLEAAGIADPPTTYAELRQACATIKEKLATANELGCYGGQFYKDEGLTVSLAEAVYGAGGSLTDGAGQPSATEADQGLQWLDDWFADGTIPSEAQTWKEEESRRAFQDGQLIFLRHWSATGAQLGADDGSSAVRGKFAVAALPGLSGPGISALGGRNLAISRFAENKGTALEFIKYLTQSEQQRQMALRTGQAPILTSLDDDPELNETYAYYPVLIEVLQTARQRPSVVNYYDVSAAIQGIAFEVIQDRLEPAAGAEQLQSRLEELTS